MTRRFSELRRSLVVGGAVVAVAVFMAAPASTKELVTAENAWVPWGPAAIKVHVAYMTVANHGDVEDDIVGVQSPDYQRIELHASAIENGLNIMRPVDKVTVPANGRVAFEPGGLHIMLMGPKRSFAIGDRVQIALRLRGGGQVQVSAIVRRRDGGNAPDHHSHGHAR